MPAPYKTPTASVTEAVRSCTELQSAGVRQCSRMCPEPVTCWAGAGIPGAGRVDLTHSFAVDIFRQSPDVMVIHPRTSWYMPSHHSPTKAATQRGIMITGGVGWGTGSAASHTLKSPRRGSLPPATRELLRRPHALTLYPGTSARPRRSSESFFTSPGEVSPSRHGRFSVTLSVIANQTRLSTEPPRRRGVTRDSGKLLVSTPLTPRRTFRGEEARLRQRARMSPDGEAASRETSASIDAER